MATQSRFDTISLDEISSKHLNIANDDFLPVVLVVDDEAVIADTLTLILRQKNFAALAAYNAESALELAQLIPPDVLISDVVMPGMNGVDLAIAMRAAIPDCQVV